MKVECVANIIVAGSGEAALCGSGGGVRVVTALLQVVEVVWAVVMM